MALIKNIKKGDLFCEYSYGEVTTYVAVCNPCARDEGFAIYGDSETGERVYFFQHSEHPHYVQLEILG